MRIMSIMPLKENRLLFVASNGNYYCNLKYIAEYILKESPEQYELVWVANNNASQFPKNIKLCTKWSVSFWYYVLTAKVVIFNGGVWNYLWKRPGQYYVETWHGGGAYKKVLRPYNESTSEYRKKLVCDVLATYDYVISSSAGFTEAFEYDMMLYQSEFLPYGMARNDIFFNSQCVENAARGVREVYQLANVKIAMYAPTWRDDGMANTLDFAGLLQALDKKYQAEFVLFIRCHPHVASDIFTKYAGMQNIIDVSAYPDMQELLCAADVLLTDYSSSMWDFSLTFKPCFIYATDIAHYRVERDFHTPMEEWPFPIATDNAMLQQKIAEFDYDAYVEAVERHHAALGSYEDGHAAERVAGLLERLCQE